MTAITKEQRAAIYRLWLRARDPGQKIPTSATYRQFRRGVVAGYDCLMIELWGMWIGIERDGYTHS